jgi:hypothetical protein
MGGNPTLSAGTANGVLFLNGSKAVTSGSALTFDGSKLSLPSLLAIKGAQNGNIAIISMTRTDQSWSINNETDLRFYGQNADTETPSNILHSMNGGGTFVWNNGSGSEQMRLTSTGLGIGTSSPTYKLDVSTALTGTAAGDNTAIALNSQASGRDVNIRLGDSVNATARIGYLSGALYMFTNGAERLRLNTSGNLGLGVTPSAWSSASSPALQLPNGAALFTRTGGTYLSQNFFYNSSDNGTYIANGFATLYKQASGNHQWFNAPSGTAGNAAALTQAMTLDASGNLLVGTTSSPAYGSKLRVEGGIETFATQFNVASGTSAQFELVNRSASAGFDFYVNSGGTLAARIPAAGGMVVGTAALTTTATDGFLYVPTCAGTPTGTPTTQTGTAPIVVDTTNNKLYFYSGGQWRDAGP